MECSFVYGFLWARLQTGGWETVASTDSHSLEPSQSPALLTPTCFSSFLLSSKMSKIFQLSLFFFLLFLTQLQYTRDIIFHYSQLHSYLLLVWTWLFLEYRSSLFFPLIFQAHRCTECIWSLSVALRSAFLFHAASAQKMFTSVWSFYCGTALLGVCFMHILCIAVLA